MRIRREYIIAASILAATVLLTVALRIAFGPQEQTLQQTCPGMGLWLFMAFVLGFGFGRGNSKP